MTATAPALERSFADRSPVGRTYRRFLAKAVVTMVAVVIVSAYLLPLLYMVTTAFQQPGQASTPGAPIYPAAPLTGTYEGRPFPIYEVPIDGTPRALMLVEPGRESSVFVDPKDATATKIEWQGRWRTLTQAWTFAPETANFTTAWSQLNFPRLLFNTGAIAILSTIGAVVSSTLVAYGFARFRFPGRGLLFTILLATIFLPGAVTLIPTYTIFVKIGWVGTWLPILVPAFFANAYDVFLLRQYFLTIPRDLDEAAMIDGASAFRILRSVVLPQAFPVIVAVSIFTFVYAWNDFFGPLIYLAGQRDLQPLQVVLANFSGIYYKNPAFIQVGNMLTLGIPVIIFILFQRVFIRGIVITGVEK
jgi:multiple sugar transport system permease protein